METLADLARLRARLGESPENPLDIRPGFDPIAALRINNLPPPGNERARPVVLPSAPVGGARYSYAGNAGASVAGPIPPGFLDPQLARGLGSDPRQAVLQTVTAEAAVALFTSLAWNLARVPARYRRLYDWRPLAWLLPPGQLSRGVIRFRAVRGRLARWQPLRGLAIRRWARAGRPGLAQDVVIDPHLRLPACFEPAP